MTQKTLYFLRGISGSGKSTWAKELVANSNGTIKKISKDDLRLNDAGIWSKNNEKTIVELQDITIRYYLGLNYSVVVDNTHLAGKWEQHFRDMAKECNAVFIIKEFFDVTVEECIKRDLARPVSVGEKVIRDQVKLWNKNKLADDPLPVYIPPEGKPVAVIFDLDGTICKRVSRSPYAWGLVGNDEPIQPIIDLAQQFHNNGDQVIFISGRDEICYPESRDWLNKYVGEWTLDCPLLMRPLNNKEKDTAIKERIFQNKIKDNYRVRLVCDDRRSVVLMWRSLGLTCLEVATSEF